MISDLLFEEIDHGEGEPLSRLARRVPRTRLNKPVTMSCLLRWVLDGARGPGGERVRLEKLPMEVLTLLVRSSGALVPRGEIQAALWGSDVFVEHDSAINTAVRKIRRALGDHAEKPRFVET